MIAAVSMSSQLALAEDDRPQRHNDQCIADDGDDIQVHEADIQAVRGIQRQCRHADANQQRCHADHPGISQRPVAAGTSSDHDQQRCPAQRQGDEYGNAQIECTSADGEKIPLPAAQGQQKALDISQQRDSEECGDQYSHTSVGGSVAMKSKQGRCQPGQFLDNLAGGIQHRIGPQVQQIRIAHTAASQCRRDRYRVTA